MKGASGSNLQKYEGSVVMPRVNSMNTCGCQIAIFLS